MPAGGCDHGEEEEKEEELTRQGRSRRDIARDWKSKGPARALALFIFVARMERPSLRSLGELRRVCVGPPKRVSAKAEA